MSSSLISKIIGVPAEIIESDMSQLFTKEVDGISKDATTDEKFVAYMSYTFKRSKGKTRGQRVGKRLEEGRAIKPCGNECYTWGDLIISSANHISMINSKILVNDEEYLYHAAKITPNPKECANFFYEYVNEYLKKNPKFRMNFLKALFLNVHVLTRKDILVFVKEYNYEHEYETLIRNEQFRNELLEAFEDVSNAPDYIVYNGKSWETTKGKYSNYELACDAKLRRADLLSSFDENKRYKLSESGLNVED